MNVDPGHVELSSAALTTLVRLAARTITVAVVPSAWPTGDDATPGDDFQRPGASFVTLRLGTQLRGCIGSLSACRPLLDDVLRNARAAALDDPRFEPLAAPELEHTSVEIAVLSTTERLAFADETDLMQQLRPGLDGVILAYAGQRATYLPSVWAQLPQPHRFVEQLRHKAGIPVHIPTVDLHVERYTVSHSPRLHIGTLAPLR
ncbi:MAG: AmmeMemoRadiSam system protein A [Gammaproteobacteria bacterium]